jgi:hypothetical protein
MCIVHCALTASFIALVIILSAMDPLGSITTLASVISFLLDVASKVQQNRAECVALGAHAQSLLDLLKNKRAENLPEDLAAQLNPLIKYVSPCRIILEIRSAYS